MKSIRLFSWIFFAGGLALFIALSTRVAQNKPIWEDESFGLREATQKASYGSLIVNGAKQQGSPAPLYFLFLKVVDQGRDIWTGWNIPETLFLRWTALLPTLLIAASFILLRPKEWSLSIVIVGTVMLLFSRLTFLYSMEARAYALWLLLSTLSLLGVYRRYENPAWAVVFMGLGATSIASVFQILALALALVCAHAWMNRFPEKPLQLAVIHAAGFAVALYYAMHSYKFGYIHPESGTWLVFFRFLSGYAPTIFLNGLVVAWAHRERDLPSLCLSLSTLFLFLMSPMVFWITRYRGVFFAERQYIYWVASVVVVLVMTGQHFWEKYQRREPLLQPVTGFSILFILLSIHRLGIHKTALKFVKVFL